MFKKYENPETKTISREQATLVLRQLRKSTQAGIRQQDRVSFDARAIKASEEDFFRTNKHLVGVLFHQKDAINVHDLIDLQY